MAERLLHPFAIVVTLSTVLLLSAGALVTSTGSGLAVPDWPLSFGQFFPEMVGGVLFEHGHRLVAGAVASLVVFYAIFARAVARRTVRRLAWLAVGIVLTQAGLGGVTVLLKLPPIVSVFHACLAQVFFCVVVTIALVTSRLWANTSPRESHELDPVRQMGLIVPVFFFVQLVLGATMRHSGAGLAIPDFPLVFGGLWPPFLNFSIGIHLAHRIWAVFVTVSVIVLAAQIHRRHPGRLDLVAFSGALLAAVTFQILLGSFTIWLKKPVVFTMLHLTTGAICLAISVVLALLINRVRLK